MYNVDFHYLGGSCKARLNRAGRLSFVEPLAMLDVADAMVGNTVGQRERHAALGECNDQPHKPISHRYTGRQFQILFLHCFPQETGIPLTLRSNYSYQQAIETAYCHESGFGAGRTLRVSRDRDWWRLYQAGMVFAACGMGIGMVLAQTDEQRSIAVPYLSSDLGVSYARQTLIEGEWV